MMAINFRSGLVKFNIMLNKNILFALFLLLAVSACEEENLDTTLRLGATPELISPTAGVDFILEESNQDDPLTTFEWSAADFGFQAAVTYTIEIDEVGNNFEDAVTLASTNGLNSSDVSVGKMNNILLAKGLPFGFANPLEIRVCAKVSDNVDALCSQAVALTVSPYQAEVVYPKLTVPGDYQGWDPADEDYAVYSRKSDEIYEGYIYFEPDEANYKFAQGLSWDVNWGDNEPDGILDLGGIDNNIKTESGSGMYRLTADLNTLQHGNEKTDWGVIGDATPGGTATDTDLVWDATDGVLRVTLDLTAGSLRFRANDTDDLNFGDDFTNGTLEYGGEAIPVAEAGNYTIDLMLNVSDYSYTIIKN